LHVAAQDARSLAKTRGSILPWAVSAITLLAELGCADASRRILRIDARLDAEMSLKQGASPPEETWDWPSTCSDRASSKDDYGGRHVPVSAVRFRFWGQDGVHEARIRDGLAAGGIQLTSFEVGGADQSGIVCFTQIDNGLFTFIQDCQGSVFALATSPSALENGCAWRLLEVGAADVIVWNDASSAGQILAKLERRRDVERLTTAALAQQPVAGESPAWRCLVRRVAEAGRFSRSPVLLTGESGTGKELLARLIHAVDSETDDGRRRRELVTVDCSTIVPELSGSELFGHERGAFTGAHSARDGAFALADGATLFLDEVGELPLQLQAQLLRAIQEKTYKRVGGNVWLKTNFRLVCATNRDLGDLVRRGRFRLDLYHRIAGWVFRTLPIRERRGDILPLARYFLATIIPDGPPDIDDDVRRFLVNRDYAGNIRELRQLVERIAHRHASPGPITVGDIPEDDRPCDGGAAHAWPDERLELSIADAIAMGAGLREITTAATAAAIRIAVRSEHGNLQRAAKRLGVTDRALQMRRAAGALSEHN
jgi:DNA-binding NtrC family response regulator